MVKTGSFGTNLTNFKSIKTVCELFIGKIFTDSSLNITDSLANRRIKVLASSINLRMTLKISGWAWYESEHISAQ